MSESTEMYLETILVIQKKKGHVRSIDIAHEMNFSKPTISQQMKRLKEKERDFDSCRASDFKKR